VVTEPPEVTNTKCARTLSLETADVDLTTSRSLMKQCRAANGYNVDVILYFVDLVAGSMNKDSKRVKWRTHCDQENVHSAMK
jgi:hypothetical protein